MNVELLKNYAVDMLEVALKNDKLYNYVTALPPYSITTKDELGNDVECTFAKIESIYSYYKKNPTCDIDKKMFDILFNCLYKHKTLDSLLPMLSIVEYQIVAEKENRAPFVMENDILLGRLRENLQNNRSMYQSKIYESKNFMTIFQEHDEMLSRNYGHKIL